jgi:hypothetical protein
LVGQAIGGNIYSPYENPIDYDQFYAQVYHLLQLGFRYIFTSEDYKMLAEHNTEFEAASGRCLCFVIYDSGITGKIAKL